MYNIEVLMSTYNGAKYVEEQIDSILKQVNCSVNILVRDDGSTDNTSYILKSYTDRNLLTWYQGENIRPTRSFLDLLVKAEDTDFYAFADQDDYWMADKLETACRKIGLTDTPTLYFSQTQLADKKLSKIKTPVLHPLLTQGESLVYAFATGCTMVFNKALRDILISNIPQEMPMLHDFWIYIAAQAMGAKIIFDKAPHILYRQHGDNAVGLGKNAVEEWKQRIKRILFIQNPERSNNARILLNTLQDKMTADNLKRTRLFVEAKTSYIKRLQLLFNNSYRCGSLKTWILFKLAVICNTY